MRINNAGTEVDELGLHRVVHTGSETLVVRTSTSQSTFLIIIIESHIICIMCTATAQIDIMVLADTCLEYLFEPISIGIVLELVNAIAKIAISTRQRGSRILGSLT